MSSPVTMDRRELERLRESPTLGAAAAELLWASQQAADPAAYLTAALPLVSAAAGAIFAAVASSVGGKWTPRRRDRQPGNRSPPTCWPKCWTGSQPACKATGSPCRWPPAPARAR